MPSEEHGTTSSASGFDDSLGKALSPPEAGEHSGGGGVVVDAESCSTCRYWRQSARTATTGQCRRNPPIWRVDAAVSEWPRTDATDWCGEHRGPAEEPR